MQVFLLVFELTHPDYAIERKLLDSLQLGYLCTESDEMDVDSETQHSAYSRLARKRKLGTQDLVDKLGTAEFADTPRWNL